MQTSLDQFIKIRKRPASDNISVLTSRKLFAQDDDPSSPIRSPSRRIPVYHKKETVDSSTLDKIPTTLQGEETINTRTNEEVPTTLQENETVSTKTNETVLTTPPKTQVETKMQPTPVQPEPEIQPNQNEKSPGLSTPVRSPATQSKLMEEYGLGEFKRMIPRNKRFELMKSRLAQLNATKAELKKFENVELEVNTSPVKRGNLKPRRLFGVETTRSPRKDQSYVSPRKLLDQGPVIAPTESRSVRYRQLAEGKDSLILPPKYSVLAKIFDGVETVLKLLNQRGELATYKRIHKNVESMKERKFTEEHLGMIKAIYPESYELNYEMVKATFSGKESLELVIKLPKGANSVTRVKKFNSLLLERTLKLHQEFLKTLDPPLDIPTERVMSWHSEFDLNNVPDIEPAPIPRPAVRNDGAFSAKDILEKTHQLISCNKKMERAITNLVEEKINEETKSTLELASRPISTPKKILAYEKALKGIPKALLEKLRAKKAAKMAEMVTRTPAEKKEEIMYSRLPELARILRYVYVSENKNILPEEFVVNKVRLSYREKLSSEDLIEHFRKISEHLKGWLSFSTLRNTSYIRVTKDADMSRVIGKLENLARSAG